ncbi:MAG: PadR family transcriptional regulator [Candidatus Odinarchaeota archaeon]
MPEQVIQANKADLEANLRKFDSRLKQGFLRVIILHLLKQNKANHGYGLMDKIGELTNGSWKPGPSRIYPILNEFVNNGWAVVKDDPDGTRGKKIFTLTKEGELAADIRIRRTKEFLEPWFDIIIGMKNGNEGNSNNQNA